MENGRKKRLYSLLRKTALVLTAGIAYGVFVHLSGWGIPCIFHTLTKKLCPGCGITRMFLSLMQLDFVSAARYNLLVLCLLPFGLMLFLYKAWQYVKTGKTEMGNWEKLFYIIAFALCVVFTILRNTNSVPFLTMP